MDAADLPALELGKRYLVKIYDEQPFPDLAPHRQINQESLGKSIEIDLFSFGDDPVRGSGFMINGHGDLERPTTNILDEPVTQGLFGFHIWLVESITEVAS